MMQAHQFAPRPEPRQTIPPPITPLPRYDYKKILQKSPYGYTVDIHARARARRVVCNSAPVVDDNEGRPGRGFRTRRTGGAMACTCCRSRRSNRDANYHIAFGVCSSRSIPIEVTGPAAYCVVVSRRISPPHGGLPEKRTYYTIIPLNCDHFLTLKSPPPRAAPHLPPHLYKCGGMRKM